MTTQDATSAILFKYPNAIFDMHSNGMDGIVISSWYCPEFGYPRSPTTIEIQGFIYDWMASQEYALQNFNIVEFQSDLRASITELSNPNLRWEFAALNTYAINSDFEGMVGYLGDLVSLGAATQDDFDIVIAAVSKQGIIL